jgi:hypothetical protein
MDERTSVLRSSLTDWYNRKIVAGWYRSAALIGGWLVSSVIFLPDLIQFIFDNWGLFGDMLLPKVPAEVKATILALYVNFGAPPLRAWQQKGMQAKALKQAALNGNVTSRVGTEAVIVAVPGTPLEIVRPEDFQP